MRLHLLHHDKFKVLEILFVIILIFSSTLCLGQNKIDIPYQEFKEIENFVQDSAFNEEFYLNKINSYPNSLYITGITAYNFCYYLAAEKALNLLTSKKVNSKYANTYIKLAFASIELKEGNQEKGLRLLEDAIIFDSFTTNRYARYELYEFYKKANYEKSINYLRESLNIDSNFSWALFELSQFYINTHNYSQAFITLNKLININPANSNAINSIADIYYDQSDFKKSIDYYIQALSIRKNTYSLINLARIYLYNLKDLTLANNYLIQAQNFDKNSEVVNFYIGEYFYLRNEYDSAIKYYLKLDNDYKFQACNRLINIYIQLSQFNKAKVVLEVGLTISKEDFYLNSFRVLIPYLEGNINKSKEEYNLLKKQFPDTINQISDELINWGVELNVINN
jgi:tetratricopeptide (TPR) repeat protein